MSENRKISPAQIESLEARKLLSATLPHALVDFSHSLKASNLIETANPIAHRARHGKRSIKSAASLAPAVTNYSGPFLASQIRHFYGVDAIKFGSIAGDGAGQTIAIIDAYAQPHIAADLAQFDSDMGLPAPASFSIENGDGTANGSATTPSYNSNWALETSLDVEWSHAMAPGANLLLVQAATSSNNDIYNAIALARGTPGVSVISMSFGAPESAYQNAGYVSSDFTSNDAQYFTTPAGQTAGLTFVASTGDNAASNTNYPATSPDVVAVGGTTITLNSTPSSYGGEAAWSQGGGALSIFETKPAYQNNVAALSSTTQRGTPDVSFDADPGSGVYVYDSSQSSPGYYQVGGTSLSAPCWAGLIAIADQGRHLLSLPSLDGPTATLPRLYQLPSSDFHDVTTGSNGNAAGVGYDLATGLGTPVASSLVPDLAGGANITGSLFQDNNSDGTLDGSDTPFAHATVYLDLNNTGTFNAADPTAVTTNTGSYTFTDLAGGLTGTVRLENPPAGDVQVPLASDAVTTHYGTNLASANVGYFPTIFTGAASTNFTVKISGASTQILLGNAVAYTAPSAIIPSLSFSLGAASNLTIDATAGSPIPAKGIAVSGTGSADSLAIDAPSTGGSLALGASSLTLNISAAVTFSSISVITFNGSTGNDTLTQNAAPSATVSFNGGAGSDTLNILGGTYTLASDPSLTTNSLGIAVGGQSTPGSLIVAGNSANAHGLQNFHLASLTIAGNGSATLAPAASGLHADRSILTLGALVLQGGTLDITQNEVDIQYNSDPIAAIHVDLSNNTIYTSAADSYHAIGYADGADGQGVAAPGNILLMYTVIGDTNLDGATNNADYQNLLLNFGKPGTWDTGDFNNDGNVNYADYQSLLLSFGKSLS